MVSSKKAMPYSSTTGRREAPPRAGTSSPLQASEASNSCMRLGLASAFRRFHCSMGTKTAASVPRRDTTWGAFPLAGVEQLANAHFGVLYRPDRHGIHLLTGYQTIIGAIRSLPSALSHLSCLQPATSSTPPNAMPGESET